jgi:hypothetical protein
MAKKSQKQLDYELRARIVDRGAAVLETGLKYGFLALIFYFGYASLATLAGQITYADVGIRVIGDVRVSETVAWMFGVGGIGYGMRQRKLRRDTIERLSPRVRKYEQELDSHRTSTGLPSRGTTRPEDRNR